MNAKILYAFILSMVLAAAGTVARAFEIDNIQYKQLSAVDRTVVVSGINENAVFPQGVLIIPDSVFFVRTFSVVGISEDCKLKNAGIEKIVLPKTFIYAAPLANSSFPNLKSISIGEGNPYLTVLDGTTIFSKDLSELIWCPFQSELTLTEKLNRIGDYAFKGNTALTALRIPDSVSFVGEGAFSGCSSLESCTLSDGIDILRPYTFEGCTSLSNLTLPPSLVRIEEHALYNCGIESLRIPALVEYIGEAAFSGCSSLESCTLPDGIDIIRPYTFEGCRSLSNLTLPPSLVRIENRAFYNSGIEFLQIPAGVNHIGNGAFEGCGALSSCILPGDLSRIEADTFLNSGLVSMVIPGSVTYIGENAFRGCANLSSCILPETIEKIQEDTFYRCHSLKQITIPSSVRSIGVGAFASSGLEKIDIPNNVEKIEDSVFSACEALTSIKISESIDTIPTWAFRNCTALKSIDLPQSIIYISYEAFASCTALERVFLPASLKSCSIYAFASCTSLSSFEVDENNPFYSGDGPYLLTKDKTGLVCYPAVGDTLVIPEGIVNSLVSYEKSYYSQNEIRVGIFPSTLRTVAAPTFTWMYNFSYAIFKSSVPPKPIRYFDFGAYFILNDMCPCDFDYDIYVPTMAVPIYKQSWLKNFRIHPMSEVGVEEILDDTEPDSYTVYSIDGRLVMNSSDYPDLHTLPAGVYIINGEKVLVR